MRGVFERRSLREADFARMFSITRERFAYKPADRDRLAALWRELFHEESCITVAIEDHRRPAAQRVVGFGMTVFTTDDFAKRLLAGAPLLSRGFLEQWEAGVRPYLKPTEIAKANATTGVNIAVLHYGWCSEVAPEDMGTIQLMQTENYVHRHAGYRTQQYLHEVYGPMLRDFVLATGSQLRHDYRDPKWATGLAGVSEDDWPHLTGYGTDAASPPGSWVSMVRAKEQPVRFRFSPGEQDLLSLALDGASDQEIAEALELSLWTVKKRWQRVYAKVGAVDARLLPHDGQRRRHLVGYLREHPSELRPFRE